MLWCPFIIHAGLLYQNVTCNYPKRKLAMTYKSNQSGLDGANKIGNSSNAQCLKVLISKPRASSKYPEIKVKREKLKKREDAR